jgi:hypothetical protein
VEVRFLCLPPMTLREIFSPRTAEARRVRSTCRDQRAPELDLSGRALGEGWSGLGGPGITRAVPRVNSGGARGSACATAPRNTLTQCTSAISSKTSGRRPRFFRVSGVCGRTLPRHGGRAGSTPARRSMSLSSRRPRTPGPQPGNESSNLSRDAVLCRPLRGRCDAARVRSSNGSRSRVR